MIALIQRVSEARVEVAGETRSETIAAIGRGILALIGVERGDGEAEAARLAAKVLGYRIFPDAAGKMNLSLLDVKGEMLAVPQFTLVADTRSGTRAGFSTAATPDDGKRLFEHFVKTANLKTKTRTGTFGAHMQVNLVNDGPVTFWLQVSPTTPS